MIYFDEILFDGDIIAGTGDAAALQGWPEFANTVVENPVTGTRSTNVNRYDPLYKFVVPSQGLSQAKLDYLLKFWRGGYGSGIGFRLKVDWDYRADIEAFGLGNDVRTQWPLVVTKRRPGPATLFPGGQARADVRRICKPVVQVAKEENSFQLYKADGTTTRTPTNPLAIYIDGLPSAIQWVVNAKTGIVSFASAPADGALLAWSGEFDAPVTFDADMLEHVFNVLSSVNGIPFREIGFAELGLTYDFGV